MVTHTVTNQATPLVGYNVFGTASAFWLDRIHALNAKAAASRAMRD